MKNEKQPELYELLNKAFSANYTCLRIANQDMPENASMIQTREQVFKRKTLKDHWLQAKMKDAASQRLELLSAFSKAKKASFDDMNMDEEDEKNKQILMAYFNRYYKTNKTFDECFCGFEILDEDFKAVFELFDESKTIPASRLGMSPLIHTYYTFLDYWTDRTYVYATCDIIDTLSDDLNSSGYKTFYFGKPRNPKVSIITKAEIEAMILKVYEYITNFEKKSKITTKQITANSKALKKNSSEETMQQFFELQVDATKQGILEEKVKCLSHFLTVLDARLSASGKDLDDSKILRFGEGFLDLTAGVNIFDENNRLKVDQTYIHDFEREYLAFLFKQLGLENPLDAKQQKETFSDTKQKQ